MSCWALVPVKRRAEGKRRLAQRLSGAERVELVRTMLAQTMAALQAAKSLDGFAFVSAERDTIPENNPVLADPGGGPNAALDQGRKVLIDRGVTELVVLPADLPRVTGPEIDALVEAGRRTGFALAPDARGTGTNALYLPARRPFRFRFGAGSRARHLAEARRIGLDPVVVELPGLAFDVDNPEDLDRMLLGSESRYTPQPTDPKAASC